LLLASFVLVSLATRWLSLVVHVLDVDESAHIVGSWEMMRGGLLYTDFVDNKPPLLYVCYALAQRLFGRSLIGVHVFTAAIVVPLTAFAVSAFHRHGRRGMVAAAVFLAYGTAFLAHDMLASNAEILMLLPASWALVAASTTDRAGRLRAQFAAGALLGVAFLVKYQAVAWLPAVAFATAVPARPEWSVRRASSRVAMLCLAFALPLLATWAWFHARGGSSALLYWTLFNNLSYAASPIGWLEASGRVAGYLLPFLVVTGPLWWAAWRSRVLEPDDCRRTLVAGTALLSLGAATIGFRFFPHYFIQLYVPLALASAPWLEAQLWPTPTRAGRAVVAWSLFMLIGFGVANAMLYLGPRHVYQETRPVYRQAADRLRADRCIEGATLFVWGYAPSFYYYSGLPPASRFAVLAQGGLTAYVPGNRGGSGENAKSGSRIVPQRWNELLDDLERRRATYILDTSPAGIYGWNRFPMVDYPRLLDYVTQHYEAIDEVGRVVIFRRIGCGPGSQTP
jgi:4-amino-4-deoxy-L-arabinose transferase-like glycosyltransferase